MDDLLTNLIESYKSDCDQLTHQLQLNRSTEVSSARNRNVIRPKGLVITSLWEESKQMLTAKMFQHALKNLVLQATTAGIELDFLVVANNGGCGDAEVSQHLISHVQGSLQQTLPGHRIEILRTTPPTGASCAGKPWAIEATLAGDQHLREGSGTSLVIIQPSSSLNQGKIRAIRDVAHFVTSEIYANNYYVDFIFQMDAETILYHASSVNQQHNSPFGSLFKFFHENGFLAVGTKDRFSIMNPENGLPVAKPIGTLQLGFQQVNAKRSLISLSGGALMAQPASYLAAMQHLAKHLPGLGVEDYAYTQLLRCVHEHTEPKFHDLVAVHSQLQHLNRTPSRPEAAIAQIANWRNQNRAVDRIFPLDHFVPMGIVKSSFLVAAARIADTSRLGLASPAKLLEDVINLPKTLRVLYSDECSDISDGASMIEYTREL